MTKLGRKRNLFLGVCTSFILLVAGCGSDDTANESETASSDSAEVVTTASISNNPEEVAAGLSAEGFELAESTVEGNITFDSQELMDSAKLDRGTVTGEITVAE